MPTDVYDPCDLIVKSLRGVSRAEIEKLAPEVAALPAVVRAGLPGIFAAGKLVVVPSFAVDGALSPDALLAARFSPRMSLLIEPFYPATAMPEIEPER